MEKYGIIYKITNKINGKVYIGQTIEKRGFKGRYEYSGEGIERGFNYYKHFKAMNKHYNSHLYNAIKKYGFEAFEVDEEFDIAYSKEELDKLEIKYIKEFNCLNPNGYNDQTGGNTHEVSEITKQKMSKNNSGEGNPMYGRRHSNEAKELISKANKGKEISEETRQKLSKSLTGRHHSEETKQRIREKSKGKTVSEETKKKISNGRKGYKNPRAKAVYCEEFKEIRLTINEWSKELNLDISSIRRVCNGEYSHTKNYHFRWATEKEIKEYRIKHNIEE